jgi:prepilin-type processing-associated H-X9-DG protein
MGVQATVDPARYATPATNRSAMFRNSAIRLTHITDGTACTILLVECAARPLTFRGRFARPDLPNDQGQGWVDSEGPFSLDGSNDDGSLQGQGPVLTPQAINATNENEPYSFHSGGGNFLFADGHVQFIAETIPLEVFAAL